MSELTPEIAAKTLAADDRNLLAKVGAGATLTAAERKRLEALAADNPDRMLVQGAASAAAPFLFSEMTESVLEKLAEHGEFTGERLLKSDPEKYESILRFYGEGMGVTVIARALRVSHNTVYAVLESNPEFVASLKERTMRNLRKFSGLAAERLIEEAAAMSHKDLAIALGISVEKSQLLAGEATARIERKAEVKSHEEFAKLVDLLPDADGMGLPAESPTQIAHGDRRPPAARVLPVTLPPHTSAADIQSADPATSNSDGALDDTSFATDPTEETPESAPEFTQGGRGSENFGGGQK